MRTGSVHLHLEKNLPVQSGIGGGSADAAATLSLLCDLWALDDLSDALPGLALSLGADVPMCLSGTPALITGIGEGIRPLPKLPSLPMMLVNPLVGVATPQIFRSLTKKDNPPLVLPDAATTRQDWIAALSAMRNDLEPPARALAPVIGAVSDLLTEAGARLVRMSGSGATCFGIFDADDDLDQATAFIRARAPDWYIQPCLTRGAGHGPT